LARVAILQPECQALFVDKNGSELVKQQSQVFMVTTTRGEQDYYCAIFMTASKVKSFFKN
jgi:hypothetical protein